MYFNRFFVLLILLQSLNSFTIFGESKIFDCLNQRTDFPCLQLEMYLNPFWYAERDASGKSLVERAIESRDPRLYRFIVERGAIVEGKYIIDAMEKYFLVDKNLFNLPPPELEKKNSLAAKLMIAATNDEEPYGAIVDIANIIDLFAEPVVVAQTLQELYLNNLITERDLKLFISEYKNLFLQDKNLSKDEIITIVQILFPLHVNQFLLEFIIVSEYNVNFLKPKTPRVLSTERDNIASKKLALSIVERSRQKFLELPPNAFVQQVIVKEHQEKLLKLVKENEKLTNFIEKSILFPTNKLEKIRNYEFWREVYRTVLAEHDFQSAFAIGNALNSSNMLKALKKVKKFEDPSLFSLVDPHKNYKSYRHSQKISLATFNLPSHCIIMKDLTHMGELDFFEQSKNKPVLVRKLIDYYKKYRSELALAREKAQQTYYFNSHKYLSLVEHIMSLEIKSEDTITGAWLEAYQQLWPLHGRISLKEFSSDFNKRHIIN